MTDTLGIKKVTYSDFVVGEYDGKSAVVVETVPPHMRPDFEKRNANIKNGRHLCERCEGTGNELMSKYRQCSDCLGKGHIHQSYPPIDKHDERRLAKAEAKRERRKRRNLKKA